jgi:hypothetical protein
VRTWNFILPPPRPRRRPRSPTAERATAAAAAAAAAAKRAQADPRGGLKGVSPSLLHALDVDPRSIMRRRSSLVVDDLPPEVRAAVRHRLEDASVVSEDDELEPNGVHRGGAEEEKKAPGSPVAAAKKPAQFKEPDPNSLLDSFGF